RYRDLTARENLRHQARLHDVDTGRVEELLGQAGLARRADEPLRTLSRGTVQRVAACRAGLHEPELLLLDEPRAHLDLRAAELLAPLIGRDSGATRVITSHDPAAGLAEADLVIGLRHRRIAVTCPASSLTPAD